MSTTTGPIRFDPFDPAFTTSPYEQYARLRDEDPVHWSELLWGWVITRYDDVATVLREPTMSSDVARATPTPITTTRAALMVPAAVISIGISLP